MTRSEMVINVLAKNGATITKDYPVNPRRKTGEKQTVIILRQTHIQMTQHHLYITEGTLNDVRYDGLIPPTESDFKKLLTWLSI